MPMYDYTCKGCGETFEAIVASRDAGGVRCPACSGEEVKRSSLATFAIASSGGMSSADLPEACRSCGDPRGPGACGMR